MSSDMFSALARSKVLTYKEAPGLISCIERMAKKGGTSVSSVRLLPTKTPNAAFHPASGGLWVTEGILDLLDSKNLRSAPSKEMQAVIGHELGHARFRLKHFGKPFALILAMPLLAEAAYYLIERTNEKVRESKLDNPDDHPKAFWDAFHEVTHEIKEKGAWHSLKDAYKWSSPTYAKMFSKDPKYRDMPWRNAFAHEAKLLAIQAAVLVPSLYACRPFALQHEFEADRFAVALMGESKSTISVFEKLMKYSEERLGSIAKTPVQKSWVEKIKKALTNILHDTIMAHPPLPERVKILRGLDPESVARSFGISP